MKIINTNIVFIDIQATPRLIDIHIPMSYTMYGYIN